MTYDNRNSIIFGKNERKEKDTHPDLTGTFVDKDGVDHWFSAWKKEKNGRVFYTGNMKPKEDKGAAPNLDETIPF